MHVTILLYIELYNGVYNLSIHIDWRRGLVLVQSTMKSFFHLIPIQIIPPTSKGKPTRQTFHHIHYRPHNKIRSALLVDFHLVFIHKHGYKNVWIILALYRAIVHYHVQVIARVSYVQTAADAAWDTCDRQLQGARVGFWGEISRDYDIPPTFAGVGLHHFERDIDLWADATGDDAEVGDTCGAQLPEGVGREEHFFVMHVAVEVGQVARGDTVAFFEFVRAPVKFVVDFADDLVVELRGGWHDRTHPFHAAVAGASCLVCEIGPFLKAAFGEGCAFPFAQAGSAEGCQQITHVPVVIIAARLFEGDHVVVCQQVFPLAPPPIQAVYDARHVLCGGNVGGMERVDGFDEDAVNVEEDGVKGGGELQVRSFPDNRGLHEKAFRRVLRCGAHEYALHGTVYK